MKNGFLFLFLLVLVLVGCGSDNESDQYLPSNEFAESYSLSDFNLGGQYDYWEIRKGALPDHPVEEYEVLLKFDDAAYESLDNAQVQLVSNTLSVGGFAGLCMPSFCPVYAVFVQGYSVNVIDSGFDLIEFFNVIDTEAELWVRLKWAQDYASSTTPLFYEPVEDGYLVVLAWDSLCQLRGKDLVKVYPNGEIEIIREIESEQYSACV